MTKWQPIETAPQDDGVLHVRGLWVHSSITGKRLYFDACAGFLSEGDFLAADGDDHGWAPDSYEYWHPLDMPPEGQP